VTRLKNADTAITVAGRESSMRQTRSIVTDGNALSVGRVGPIGYLGCASREKCGKIINVFVLNDGVLSYFGAFFNPCPLSSLLRSRAREVRNCFSVFTVYSFSGQF
jgi:hypothetical protein